jgi:Big-like domain-containing protein/YDG domain-containing protein
MADARRAVLGALVAVAGLALAFQPLPAHAAPASLSALGAAYTQNFSTLSNTAGSTTNTALPAGWALIEGGGGARDNDEYAVDTGGSTTGDTYSYGSAGSTERAFGMLRSGTLIPIIGANFTNNTGSTVTSLDVAYTGEQWRLGTAGRTDRIDFQYSLDATDLESGAWTDVDALDFTAPVTTPVGALDGNAAANRTAVSHTISGLSIANGATFWIRWTDLDASGADDGLAVDDFSLTPQSAPVAVSTTLALTSSANPSTYGDAVTFTATVCPTTGTTAPTGTVQFTVDAVATGAPISLSTVGATAPCARAVSAPLSSLSAGTYAVSAAYTPADGTFGGSSSTLAPAQTVAQRPITVTAAANTKTYDGNTSAAALPTITAGTLASGDTAAFTETYDNPNVGTNKTLTPAGSVVDGNGGNNYAVTFVATNTGVITAPPNTTVISGDHPGPVTVASGTTVIISGGHVTGAVDVRPGGSLTIDNGSTVTGSVSASSPASVRICASTINGSVSVSGATGPVVVGDPINACPGNVIGSTVSLNNNHGGVAVGGNRIGGGLNCAGNAPPPTNDAAPNTVTGARTGQCASL